VVEGWRGGSLPSTTYSPHPGSISERPLGRVRRGRAVGGRGVWPFVGVLLLCLSGVLLAGCAVRVCWLRFGYGVGLVVVWGVGWWDGLCVPAGCGPLGTWEGSMMDERIRAYADELVGAGFDVWFTSTGSGGGWLTYRDPRNDCWGTLQHGMEGWQHLMPIPPSRVHGSSMFVQDRRHPRERLDPFSVFAAQRCARPSNWNELVGVQRNAPAYLSPKAVRLSPVARGGDGA